MKTEKVVSILMAIGTIFAGLSEVLRQFNSYQAHNVLCKDEKKENNKDDHKSND